MSIFRLSGFVLLASFAANAKLAPSSFSEFVAESDVILEATPRQLNRHDSSNTPRLVHAEESAPKHEESFVGEAQLTVLRVLKGTYTNKEVTVRWTGEVHDQTINSLTQDVLLFLKKRPSGEYEPTHYGRSIWPFAESLSIYDAEFLDRDWRGFDFEYPLDMLRFTNEQEKALLGTGRKNKEKRFRLLR
jgi:hypothetical protein